MWLKINIFNYIQIFFIQKDQHKKAELYAQDKLTSATKHYLCLGAFILNLGHGRAALTLLCTIIFIPACNALCSVQ